MHDDPLTFWVKGEAEGGRERERELGVQVRNMKMVFNISALAVWTLVIFEKLMMKIYDFFYSSLGRSLAGQLIGVN